MPRYVERKNWSWLSSALRWSQVWSGGGSRANRVISVREVYGGWASLLSYTVDVTTSVRCDDTSSLSSSSATSFRWLVALLALLPRPTFQSKAIDEVANSRRRTILVDHGWKFAELYMSGETVSPECRQRNYSRGSALLPFLFRVMQVVAAALTTTMHSSHFPLIV